MNRHLIMITLTALAVSAQAALPSLTDIAETISNLRERLAENTNWQARAEARIEAFRDRIENLSESRDAMLAVIEGDKNLRERYHGGRIAQYILTNDVGRIIRVDLYADATCWTNGATEAAYSAIKDPEARLKAVREAREREAERREAAQAAFEAACLPPDLAALRARQRAAKRQEEEE